MILAQELIVPHIDTGQIIITVVMALFAYFMKRILERIEDTLLEHGKEITSLKIKFAEWDGRERRARDRRNDEDYIG